MDEQLETEEVAAEATEQVTEQTTGVDSNPPAEAAVENSGSEGGAIEVSGIDEETASLAKFYGLDPGTYGNDPARVKQAVSHFDRQLAEFGRSLWQQPQQAKPEAPKPSFDLDKVLPPDLNDADYDPAIAQWAKQNKAALKALHDHYEQQLAATREQHEQVVQERVGALEQRYQQEQEKHYQNQLDGFFTGLGGEWEQEFGKGSVKSLPPHSPLLAARNAVVQEALALQSGYSHHGIQPPPFEDLMKRALASRYSDKQTTFIRQQLVNEASTKRPPASAGSSAKRGVPMTGREKAAQTWRDGLKALRASGTSLIEQ